MIGEIGIVGREPMAASRFLVVFRKLISAATIRRQDNSRNLKMHSPKATWPQ